MRRLFLATALCGWLFASGQTVQAGLVLDFTGGTAVAPNVDAIGGWEFNVNSAITVNALGFWDEGANGLTNRHDVGLWDISQNLLASTTVTTASSPVASTSAAGQWLFNAIVPLTLAPGNYVVGATFLANDADLARAITVATTTAGVSFVTARQVASSSLAFPTIVSPVLNAGIFGPNLLTGPQPAPVPEPATLGMAGTAALVGLIIARRRVKV